MKRLKGNQDCFRSIEKHAYSHHAQMGLTFLRTELL